jgi:hypothetical protein
MPDEITTYVSRYASELDPDDVRKIMAAHFQPDDQPGTHVQWATRVKDHENSPGVITGIPHPADGR